MTGNSIFGKSRAAVLALMLVVSAFAIPLAFSGGVLADGHQDAEVEDNGLYWNGQVLKFTDASVSSGDEIVVREVVQDGQNTLEGQYVADSNGAVFFDTQNFEPGLYQINDASGSEILQFEVAEQDLTVEGDEDTITNADTGDNNGVNFEFTSNRASYDVYVSEVNDNYAADELGDVFESGSVVQDSDGDDQYRIQNPSDVTANFSGEDAGDYEFEFEVVDTGVTDSAAVTVEEIGSIDASFVEGPYTSTVGDKAAFTVSTTNTDTVHLQVGDSDSVGYQYEFDVDVSDADGDVTVLFDTTKAGNEVVPVEIEEDSDGVLQNAGPDQNLNNPLEPASYELRASVDGTTQDVTNLRLTERSTDSAASYIAPQTADLQEVEDIDANAVEGSTVALQDNLVFEVQATGLYATIDDSTTMADLEEGSTFAQNNGVYVTMEQSDEVRNQDPKELDVSQGTLVVDEDNNRLLMVFSTDDLDVEDEENYNFEFVVDGNNQYVEVDDDETAEDVTETVSTDFSVAERTVEFDGVNDEDNLVVENTNDVTVTATTTVAPGTELRTVAEATGQNAFFFQDTSDVASDQTAEFNFDLSSVANDTEFTFSVDGFDVEQDALTTPDDSVVSSNLTVEVVDAESGNAVSGVGVALQSEGETVSTAEVGDDGTATFESVEEGSYTVVADGEAYEGSTEVEVGADAQTVTLEVSEVPTYALTVNVADENGESVSDAQVFVDGEEYAVEDGSAVAEGLMEGDYEVVVDAEGYQSSEQTVTVSEDASVDATLTAEEPADGTDSGSSDGTDGTDDGTDAGSSDGDDGGSSDGNTSDSTPGFGAIVALIALIAAALLAVRRNN